MMCAGRMFNQRAERKMQTTKKRNKNNECESVSKPGVCLVCVSEA